LRVAFWPIDFRRHWTPGSNVINSMLFQTKWNEPYITAKFFFFGRGRGWFIYSTTFFLLLHDTHHIYVSKICIIINYYSLHTMDYKKLKLKFFMNHDGYYIIICIQHPIRRPFPSTRHYHRQRANDEKQCGLADCTSYIILFIV